MLGSRSLETFGRTLLLLVALTGAGLKASAQKVSLRLITGDRISGTVISTTTNHLVISNSWIATLEVPIDQIESGWNSTTSSPGAENVATMVFADAEVPNGSMATVKTNAWSGEAQVGLDVLFGAKDREMVYGRFKLAYQRPYESNPKKYFRNVFDYSIEYGRTETRYTREGEPGEPPVSYTRMEPSSDRMSASAKTSFDLMGDWYVYSLVGGGYDDILKIDARYEAGPGLGYHLITDPHLTLNVEGGLNYQAQYRNDGSDLQDVYYRVGQDLTWKLTGKLSLVEKLEYFPRINFTGHRVRFETTLKYVLWKNLSLNLSVLDLYDTQPAQGVSENEFQVRSSLGLKF